MKFNFSTKIIDFYIKIVEEMSMVVSPAIIALSIDVYGIIRTTSNSLYQHAEEILLQYSNNKIMFITIEPCPSCMFKIANHNTITHIFYLFKNRQYGAISYFKMHNLLKKKIKIFCINSKKKHNINLKR